MTFLYFERTVDSDEKPILSNSGETYRLAGYNLIHKAWKNKGCPVNKGWHVSAGELIALNEGGSDTVETKCLAVDFKPRAKNEIVIGELLDIYAFTWADDTGPTWTPLMLRFSTLLEEACPSDQKERKLKALPDPGKLAQPGERDEFIEFLYIKGENGGWNWGANGRTNAVFIHGKARDYFRKFF